MNPMDPSMQPCRIRPAKAASPLFFDSPHSARHWPATGTATIASESALLSSWDAWIDELWTLAADGRAPVLAAGFHRAWIDVNRPRDDIDAELLDGPWPGPLRPQPTSRRGMGLIRRFALPGQPMYQRPLAVAEVLRRIETAYDPYHRQLSALHDAAIDAFGFAVHIDCHSMKSVGNAMNEDSGERRPDIVVSDRQGTSCEPMLTRWIAALLGEAGYDVRVNHPYRGAEIVRRHGRPLEQRHAIQIEINRALYMDEARFEQHAGFDRLAERLRGVVGRLHDGLMTELRHLPREDRR